MRTKDLRADMRIPVNQRGTLNSGDAWFPCLIEDMSESGILIMSNREFSVGQVLDFRCEVFTGKMLECKLEVRHVEETSLGTKIIEIDEEAISLCHDFLEEQYGHRLAKVGSK